MSRTASLIRVACVQISAGRDSVKNFRAVEPLLFRAARLKCQFVVLPENFLLRGSASESERLHKSLPGILAWFRSFASQHRMTIIAGSVPEYSYRVRRGPKWANTCYVFSESGEQLLSYRKMHLFDVDLPSVRVRESRHLVAGNTPGFFEAGGIKAGVGICYDLRFPEYFRSLSLNGAKLLFVPANFTAETGKTAWEVLLRARAIENQCFVIAAGQCGRHPETNILSYGNSLIVDPLGRVLKKASKSRPGLIMADLDLRQLNTLRARLPVLKHVKIRAF